MPLVQASQVEIDVSPHERESDGFIPVPLADIEDREPGEVLAIEDTPSNAQMREMAILLHQQVKEERRYERFQEAATSQRLHCHIT